MWPTGSTFLKLFLWALYQTTVNRSHQSSAFFSLIDEHQPEPSNQSQAAMAIISNSPAPYSGRCFTGRWWWWWWSGLPFSFIHFLISLLGLNWLISRRVINGRTLSIPLLRSLTELARVKSPPLYLVAFQKGASLYETQAVPGRASRCTPTDYQTKSTHSATTLCFPPLQIVEKYKSYLEQALYFNFLSFINIASLNALSC